MTMADEINEVSDKKKPATKGPFAGAQSGKAIVLVPADQYEQQRVAEALEQLHQDNPGSPQPRVFSKITVKRKDGSCPLDASFTLFTAVFKKGPRRDSDVSFSLSKPIKCGDYMVDGFVEELGEDIELGVTPEPVKVLNLPALVDALQKATGTAFRVVLHDGALRLLNT